MFIEKECDICKGRGILDVLDWQYIECYKCRGSGMTIEEFEYGDMRYDKFMELIGEMLYMYSISGHISDEAGDMIYDDIYEMVECKGIIDIEKYHKLKDEEENSK